MMELVDTHCHIQSAGIPHGGERITRQLWAKDPELTAESLVMSAADHGVTRLIVVGCDFEDSQLAISCAQTQANAWATIGIHPHEAKHYAGNESAKKQFASLVGQPKVVAIGECGLDYYYNHSPKADQTELLRYQTELAVQAGLPLTFHVREAFDDFWPVFDSYTNVRGVLHSYTDSSDNLEKALERGLNIGVNGIATFTKDVRQLEVYRAIPLKSLLLETDAPFLAPAPFRGKTNQPKQVSVIAQFLAKLRKIEPEVLAGATTANARELFGI